MGIEKNLLVKTPFAKVLRSTIDECYFTKLQSLCIDKKAVRQRNKQHNVGENFNHIYKYLDYAKNSKKENKEKYEPIKHIWARNLTREFFNRKKK